MSFEEAIKTVVMEVIAGHKTAVCLRPQQNKSGKWMVVKATLHGKRDGRAKQQHIVLTHGMPNYAEREFLKKCKKAKTKPRAVWFPKG